MDKSEAIIEQYLNSLGFADIVHEPDGNVPPDFLVDGHIAVEVRRLNQHEETADGPRGIEHVQARVDAVLEGACSRLGPSPAGPSWFIVCEYRRPLPDWRVLTSDVIAVLQGFAGSDEPHTPWLEVTANFRIQLWRSTKTHPTRFVPGAFLDHDHGGAVLSEMKRNLLICMEEKKRKIARVQPRYPVWWLALVDFIGRGLSLREREQLRAVVSVEQPWDKVIFVNPTSPTSGFEL